MTRFLSEGNLQTAASRPLGLMVHWLKLAANCDTFDDHQNLFMICCILLEDRRVAREWLRFIPNGAQMMSFERPPFPHEREEPDDNP